jgi:hypothetical protein
MSVERPLASDEDASVVAETESTPHPACSMGNADYLEWRETPYTASFANFHPSCNNPDCFPVGSPAPDALDVVIRSCHYPTKYHRPASDCDRSAARECDRGADGRDRFADSDREPLTALTDLKAGDGVVWGVSQLPLTVVSPARTPSGEVELRGPDGGEYVLEDRPDGSYMVDRGYGRVSGVQRVPSQAPVEHAAEYGSDYDGDSQIEREPASVIAVPR